MLVLPIVPLVLVLEAMAAEYRGAATPRQVVWATAWALLPWGIIAALASWFVPLAVWLFAVGLVYLLRRTPTAATPVAEAWREARERFGHRRTALGRHYRWRVALAASPHLVYLFALSFLMLGVGVGLIGTAGLAMGSPETAALGAIFGTAILLLAVVVALPAAFGVVGVALAPVVRGPFGALLRSLLGLDTTRPSRARGCSAAILMLGLDLVLYAVGFGWAGVTFIGSAFPGGGSTGALLVLVPLGVVLGLRVLVGDALVLESDHTLGGPSRLLRAAVRGPRQLLELALWQATIVGLVVVLPLMAVAAVAVALLYWSQPLWLVGVVSLVGLLVVSRLGAATLLLLALHRLTLLARLAPADVVPVGVVGGVAS